MTPSGFLQIADLAADPILLLSRQGTIRAANRAITRLGRRPEDLNGKPLSEWTATPADRVADYLLHCARTREPVVGALDFIGEDGQRIHCRAYGAIAIDDSEKGEHGVIVRLADVRTSPSQFAILSQKIDELSAEIRRRKQVEETLVDLDRRKDEFLATLAHELRNPLAPIRNSLQILKMPIADQGVIHRAREMMERQVQNLVHLVDDLLDVSRVMRGRIELRRERVDLATVIAHSVETAQPLIDTHGHELSVTLPPQPIVLYADPVRLTQVISNVLTNAAKYTPREGRIWLTASLENHHAVVRVRDNGIGIAQEMLAKIFDVFVQVDHAVTRSEGGLGIGLTLVRNLVELHGGNVEAHSEGHGRGTEIVIRLPLPNGSSAPADPASKPEAAPSNGVRVRRSVLVVDDNVDAAESLAMLLKVSGNDVRVCRNGADALKIMQERTIDIVLLDLGMPIMDGCEVARRLRQNRDFQQVLLVALTGWGKDEDRRRSKEAGFDVHLVKPVDMETLQKVFAHPKLVSRP